MYIERRHRNYFYNFSFYFLILKTFFLCYFLIKNFYSSYNIVIFVFTKNDLFLINYKNSFHVNFIKNKS
ncbi:uncharacterized protein CHPS25_0018 [Chlamydia psittaci]|nr:uncharacterized protein CHPS25_0018 [Chlamydia psittaci]